MKYKVDFNYVTDIFRKNYESALTLSYVNKPLSFALYQTWVYIDKKERKNERL